MINTIVVSDPLIAPFFMVAPAIVMVLLLALTMRSVILREKAMNRRARADREVRSAYESNWRRHTAA